MTWHRFPHVPEDGARILANYKGCKRENLFDLTVREGDELSHIDRWCYYDDYETLRKRKILNEKDI